MLTKEARLLLDELEAFSWQPEEVLKVRQRELCVLEKLMLAYLQDILGRQMKTWCFIDKMQRQEAALKGLLKK